MTLEKPIIVNENLDCVKSGLTSESGERKAAGLMKALRLDRIPKRSSEAGAS
jgi:hypothetical protein